MKERTCILIFSRSADAECSHKVFRDNRLFFQSQEKRLRNLCYKTGLDTVTFDEHQQQGSTFGQRFCNAISSLFSKNYDNLIVIGGDSPQLKFKHLQASIDSLNANSACLGKSLDGGFYLLALKKQHFSYSEFVNLSWTTSRISSEVIQLLNIKSKVNFIPTLRDIDNKFDLLSLVNFSKQLYTDVILILKRLNKFYNFDFQTPSLLIKKVTFGSFLNKAPPSAF